MTAAKLAEKYNVHIMRHGLLKKNQKYHAFRGGNGTGEPVVNIAEAYTLVTLAKRIEKALTK